MGKAGARLLFPVFIHDAVLCSRSSLPFSPARRVDPAITLGEREGFDESSYELAGLVGGLRLSCGPVVDASPLI
ncbi:hypothetical protein BHM03_00048325 [Ensete ventricosum]|nr:hypothetical protein BHM03_00048325 [Ensete ventricosum]